MFITSVLVFGGARSCVTVEPKSATERTWPTNFIVKTGSQTNKLRKICHLKQCSEVQSLSLVGLGRTNHINVRAVQIDFIIGFQIFGPFLDAIRIILIFHYTVIMINDLVIRCYVLHFRKFLVVRVMLIVLSKFLAYRERMISLLLAEIFVDKAMSCIYLYGKDTVL